MKGYWESKFAGICAGCNYDFFILYQAWEDQSTAGPRLTVLMVMMLILTIKGGDCYHETYLIAVMISFCCQMKQITFISTEGPKKFDPKKAGHYKSRGY